MILPFVKYHGNGNDFIVIDDRDKRFELSQEQITKLCHRHFGIGSDGLILLRNHPEADFEMVFYNPDGSQSLCGNGSRCSIHMAHTLGMIEKKCRFMAFDGIHEGMIEGENCCVRLHDLHDVKTFEDGLFLNNGSPHFIQFVDDVEAIRVFDEGFKLRWDERFQPDGTNVSFVQRTATGIASRVFERGVENETYSSGTGTAAQAVSSFLYYGIREKEIEVETRGGQLKVSFEYLGGKEFRNIWLKGPATLVYKGNHYL